uniref:nucleoside diphosphate phosphatase n=1 Tax=Sus scrofa TaxID=9823 RepID=A0A4X1V752_PIG
MRKIPNNGNLRMTKVAYPLGLLVCLFIYVAYIKWHWASATQAFLSITETASGAQRGQQAHSPQGMAARGHEVFYGIMFDAGSTGTRVHIFQFSQQPGEVPTLTHETFKARKPGLSAYADDVEKSTPGIQELLNVAKRDVPYELWKVTPLVLKATAGLRLLPGEKAQKLLQNVKEVFKASPFLVGDDCVSIMNGTDEGVSAWITVNFLTGSLRTPGKGSVGMLDLGGGSTQITFLPRLQGTLQTSPPGYLTSLQMFNRTYKLYSYSYLGLGLMSARLAVLGGEEGKPAEGGEELVSPCLSPGFEGEWEHAKITYRISDRRQVRHLYPLRMSLSLLTPLRSGGLSSHLQRQACTCPPVASAQGSLVCCHLLFQRPFPNRPPVRRGLGLARLPPIASLHPEAFWGRKPFVRHERGLL